MDFSVSFENSFGSVAKYKKSFSRGFVFPENESAILDNKHDANVKFLNGGYLSFLDSLSAPFYISKTNSGDRAGTFDTRPNIQAHKVRETAKSKFIELARTEYFEYGFTPPSERYLLDFAEKYPGLVGEVSQEIYLSESKDTSVIRALFNALASLSYESVRPHGQVLAIAALTNPAAEIKEAAIRTYETWGHPNGANDLANVECPWPWLDEYRRQVIAYLGGQA